MTLFKCQMYLARTALIGDTFQIELEFRNVGFLRRGENRSTRRKASRSKDENQQDRPTPRPGIEPWEASALTTAPSLLPPSCLLFRNV